MLPMLSILFLVWLAGGLIGFSVGVRAVDRGWIESNTRDRLAHTEACLERANLKLLASQTKLDAIEKILNPGEDA
jgi:hypothetical protein